MAITGLTAHKEPIANLMPGVHFFPYPYALRCPLPGDRDTVGERCLEYLERSLKDPLGGVPLPAAVIMEVVQGEGGVIPAPTDFVQGVRRVTQELDIPFIIDEVQSGCGRTGSWFAFEQHGVIPDAIVSSKSIGGAGLPIAVVMHHERLDAFAPGAHTGTFRGNQLAFAAGVEYARIMRRDGILEHVRELGAYTLARLEDLVGRYEIVGEARGAGLMLGLELVDPESGAPNSSAAYAVQRAAIERGLIVELGGRGDAVVRFLPPLNVSRQTMDQALEILETAISVTTER
jgi:diaminobutyrate-2-oxoglutarate transaminase